MLSHYYSPFYFDHYKIKVEVELKKLEYSSTKNTSNYFDYQKFKFFLFSRTRQNDSAQYYIGKIDSLITNEEISIERKISYLTAKGIYYDHKDQISRSVQSFIQALEYAKKNNLVENTQILDNHLLYILTYRFPKNNFWKSKIEKLSKELSKNEILFVNYDTTKSYEEYTKFDFIDGLINAYEIISPVKKEAYFIRYNYNDIKSCVEINDYLGAKDSFKEIFDFYSNKLIKPYLYYSLLLKYVDVLYNIGEYKKGCQIVNNIYLQLGTDAIYDTFDYETFFELAIRCNLKQESYKDAYFYKNEQFNYYSNRNLDNKRVYDILKEYLESELKIKADLKSKKLKANIITATFVSISFFVALISLFFNKIKINRILKRTNSKLIIAKNQAEKIAQDKSNFLSTITHELRTPLYSITGISNLLLQNDLKPENKAFVDSLNTSANYLLNFINNILSFNSAETNIVETNEVEFKFNDVIENVKSSIAYYANNNNNNTVDFNIDHRLTKHFKGDCIKISQILINLLSNSIKFTQNGNVTLEVKLLEEHENTAKVYFEVKDNGVGISDKMKEKIFQPFSNELNGKFVGTGFGLFLVKNLIRVLGSEIFYKSEYGCGTRFWFTLVLNKTQEQSKPKISKEEIENVLVGRKVLLAEDNKLNQLITKKIVEKRCLLCDVTSDGIEVVSKYKENDYDIILMDLMMPNMDGFEATKQIRAFDKDVIILGLSAATFFEVNDKIKDAGMNGLIQKPYVSEDLYQILVNEIKKRNNSMI
ncbi:hybrid sensor histidine kinase/response regulator [Aquimarina sediminis]|uniref:hybrid sensor histidine kinase/response regulator n=1 Tax=Aquimarina sediminis TaxID=2070536 RepID=UPI0013E8ACFE|nr:ATP-binding protein [Aquimarina sediminis]